MTAKRWDEMTPAEKQAACLEARRRGLSATEIAIELGARTRNQILGCFWRIAAAARERGEEPPTSRFTKTAPMRRPTPAKADGARRRPNPYADPEPARVRSHQPERQPIATAPAAVLQSAPQQRPSDETAPPDATAVLFLKRLPNQCAWPIGDWNVSIFERTCCGARTNLQTYCKTHTIVSAPKAARTTVECRP